MYVGFGVPWVALTPAKLFGDSGFLCIYEPLVKVYERHGYKSLIYLDVSYKEVFDKANDPKKTGVQAVYSDIHKNLGRSVSQPVCDSAANEHLDSLIPVDYIITNKSFIFPQLVGQSVGTKSTKLGTPVVYVCLNAGKDNVADPLKKTRIVKRTGYINDANCIDLYMEACTYLTASYTVWTTEDQRRRGMAIARRFLSPSEVRRVEKHSMVNGCGIYDGLKGFQIPDDKEREWFKAPKENDDFAVTYLGRPTSNKNVSFIADTVMPMFALHGIKLETRGMAKGSVLPTRTTSEDFHNFITTERLGKKTASRDDYAGKVLPGINCLMYASFVEGYSILPREVIYIGRPALLPRRQWALTMVGKDYPFLYKDQTEAVTLIKKIRSGKVTDSEVKRFLDVRRNGFTCEFLADTAENLFQVCKGAVDDRLACFQPERATKLTEFFEKIVKKGEEFEFKKLIKTDFRRAGFGIGGRSRRALHPDDVFCLLRKRIECVDPKRGVFRRIQ
jgi:hypothetical protein